MNSSDYSSMNFSHTVQEFTPEDRGPLTLSSSEADRDTLDLDSDSDSDGGFDDSSSLYGGPELDERDIDDNEMEDKRIKMNQALANGTRDFTLAAFDMKFKKAKNLKELKSYIRKDFEHIVFTGKINLEDAKKLLISVSENCEKLLDSRKSVNIAPSVDWLFFQNIKLSSDIFSCLCKVFSYFQLRLLDVQNCKLIDKDLISLSEYLEKAFCLEYLCLKGNSITPHRKFSEALERNRSLKTLNMSNITPSPHQLKYFFDKVVKSKLITLNLSNCSIGDDNCELLCDLIGNKRCRIKVLILNNIELRKDISGISIAEALSHNTYLKELQLMRNELSNESARAFIKAVELSRQKLYRRKDKEKSLIAKMLPDSVKRNMKKPEAVFNNSSLLNFTDFDLRNSYLELDTVNKSLVVLALNENNIDELHLQKGAGYIADAINLLSDVQLNIGRKTLRNCRALRSRESDEEITMLHLLILSAEKSYELDKYIEVLTLFYKKRLFDFKTVCRKKQTYEDLLLNHSRVEIREFAKKLSSRANRFFLNQQPTHVSDTCRVYFGQDMQTKKSIALKDIESTESFQHELEMRSCIANKINQESPGKKTEFHKHILSHIYTSPEEQYFVFPLLGKSLFDVIQSEQNFVSSINSIRHIASNAADSLYQLHSHGFIHGDFKPRNFLKHEKGNWMLIDFDNCFSKGEPVFDNTLHTKFSSAYCAPEIAKHIFCYTSEAEKKRVVADEALDIFAFGVVLFELCTGISLFPSRLLSDNIFLPDVRVELVNWLGIPKEKLDRVFASKQFSENIIPPSSVMYAKDLIQLCLSGDPLDRPSFNQILSHPFFKEPKKLEKKESYVEKTHVFVSHVQAEAAGTVKDIYYYTKRKKCLAWLDMFANDLTVNGMYKGVKNSKSFIVILTKSIFQRPYCVLEFMWAFDLKKTMVPIIEVDDREGFYPFDREEFERDWADDNENFYDTMARNLLAISSLEFTGYLANSSRSIQKAKKVDSKVARVVKLLKDRVKRYLLELMDNKYLIPYRRRNYEAKAMMGEVMRRMMFSPEETLRNEVEEVRKKTMVNEDMIYEAMDFTVIVLKGPEWKNSDDHFTIFIQDIETALRKESDEYELSTLDSTEPYKENSNSPTIFLTLITPGFFGCEHAKTLSQVESQWSSHNPPIVAVQEGWSLETEDEPAVETKFGSIFRHSELLYFRPKDRLAYEYHGLVTEIVSRIKHVGSRLATS
eukprot:maker-scaffold_1-snap-gene-11.34-mRNA-1 protein AED:0.32 eAED:0.34 QI:58/0/0.5/1/0/0/2/0/1223